MKELIEKYATNTEHTSGLLLIDCPTGFGKTYAANSYMYDYVVENRDRHAKIFFITSLKKNLPEKELESFFKKNDKLQLFKDTVLFINSNVDFVLDNLTESLIKKIPNEIKELDEYKQLSENITVYKQLLKDKSKVSDVILTNIRNKFEVKFRRCIERKLKKEYASIEERIQVIKTEKDWQWLAELYPAVFTREKKIIFMSIDKFLVRNSTLIEPSYSFLNADWLESSLIFIDEFDATKERILNKIIDTELRQQVNIIELFKHIHGALKVHDFPASMTETETIKKIEKIADEINKKYNLQYTHKYVGEEARQGSIFLFHDYLDVTLINAKGKYIVSEKDENNKLNNVYSVPSKEVNDKITVNRMLTEIGGFLTYFQNGIRYLAEKHMKNRNKKVDLSQSSISYESALSSVLGMFNLKNEYNSYFKNAIVLNRQHTHGVNEKKSFDLSFYEKGFRYYSFEDDDNHDLQTYIYMISFDATPEKILLRLCEKAKIIGMSATATIPGVLGNYDIEYIKRELGGAYFNIPNDDYKRIKKEFENHIKEYSKIHIHTEFFNGRDSFGNYGIQVWENVFNDSELSEEVYNKIELTLHGEKNQYLRERYVRIAKAYKSFLMHENIHSFLCFLNRFPKTESSKFDLAIVNHIFEYLIEEHKEKLPDGYTVEKSIVILNSADFNSKKKDLLTRLSDGEKIFVITTYPTMGSGQNLQYKIPEKLISSIYTVNERPPNKKKDFDALYLEKPTNLLSNITQNSAESEFITFLFQMEFLQETGEISPRAVISNILKAYRIKNNTNIPIQQDRNFPSLSYYLSQFIIQAIGRINRTNRKNKNIYIFADDQIISSMDTLENSPNKLYNPEIVQFIEKLKELKENNTVNDDAIRIMENSAQTISLKAKRFINTSFLEKTWTPNRIKDWHKLRIFLLTHPTCTLEEFDNLAIPKNLYILLPEKRESYFYNQLNDFKTLQISFTKTTDCSFSVSEEAAQLEKLFTIPGVRNYFKANNFATSFIKNECILPPPLFNNIYKGALGEVVGRFIFQNKLQIQLKEITEEEHFEMFDFQVPNSEIYVDFKHWKTSTLFNNQEILLKISKKLESVNGKCAIIANIILDEENKHFKTESYSFEGLHILVVPFLYSINEKEPSSAINLDAIEYIRDIISENTHKN